MGNKLTKERDLDIPLLTNIKQTLFNNKYGKDCISLMALDNLNTRSIL